jgi:hypothetical protein
MKKGYFRRQVELLHLALREVDIRVLLATLYDILFWGCTLGAVLSLLYWLNAEASGLKFLAGGYQALFSMKPEEAALYYTQIRHFLIVFVTVIVLCLLLPLFFFTMSRYLIWNLLSRKKFNWKKYGKFVVLQLVWIALWLVPFLIALIPLFILVRAAQGTGSEFTAPAGYIVFFWTVVLIMIYYTHHLYYYYVETGKIFQSIQEAFTRGTHRIFVRILPSLLILVLFFIWIIITSKLGFLASGNTTFMNLLQVVFALLTLILISLERHYFYGTIKRTEVK